MDINKPNFEKIFNFEDRLVRFAGECILFVRKLEKSYEVEYYKNQLIRSSGSSSLNYGEAQGTITSRDFAFLNFFICKRIKRI
jgi:four helix bundle protein